MIKHLTLDQKATGRLMCLLRRTWTRQSCLRHKSSLEDYRFKFSSPVFTASVSSAEFYQDPINANLKKLEAIVRFSHPVDETKFKDRVNFK